MATALVAPRTMPKIGIVGVTIPGAVDCIQKINRLSALCFSPNEHPDLILYQPNFAPMQQALQRGDWDKVLTGLSQSIEAVAKMGVDFAIIPANTVHKVIAALQRRSSIPILNMLEIVRDACLDRKIKKVGILGTSWTMSGHLYKEVLEKGGIEEIVPSEEEQMVVQNAILLELVPTGAVSAATLKALLEIAASLKRRGCEAIALACTELPLVLNSTNCDLAVIDSTEALARAALQKAAQPRDVTH